MSARPWPGATDDELIAAAIRRAEHLVERAADHRRASTDRLLRTLAHPEGARLGRQLADRLVRPPARRAAARQLASVVAEVGIPRSLSLWDRLALGAGARLSGVAPRIVSWASRRRMRALTRTVILPAAERPLGRHLARRRAAGFGTNVNLLGEAILGDGEAARRAAEVRALVARPEVDAVSVKASSLVANMSALALSDTTARLVAALRPLLEEAAAAEPPRSVTLDTEEYRDLEPTLAAFLEALEEPSLRQVQVGIVLQAYLPDSLQALDAVADVAAAHRRAGGPLPRVRIVKGANLAMERVEAELHGWPQAPYATKQEVDANFKRLVESALRPDRIAGLRVGVGSHNPFDVAYALELRERCPHPDHVEVEMLEGVAERLAEAVRDEVGRVLLYTPVVTEEDFPGAVAYLARRLDEVEAPSNVLGRLSRMRAGDEEFRREAERFSAAVRDRRAPTTVANRDQDRTTSPRRREASAPFANAPDTDFTRQANRGWVAGALAEPIEEPPGEATSVDAVDRAVARARDAATAWASTPPAERLAVLARLADALEARRATAIAHMVHEARKVVAEADVEVSEAVDFVRWCASCAAELAELEGAAMVPLGVIAVAPPWNFPFSIPIGGVAAALAAGSAAILKPAPQTPATAWQLMGAVAEAGAPDGLVQYLRCPEDEVGRRLVTHPDVAAVVLTGSIDTAALFRSWRPTLRLHAETSGKNALVITATADLDQAVRDLVHSAFGHAGQKCSAASLAIVEAPVHDDPGFRRRLRDAVASLPVGPAADPPTVVPPLIGPPSRALERAFTTLDPGETWLVEPRCLDPDTHLWSPGVRLGVRPGSWFHHTECFGPVLGVVRARDLDEAVAIQNGVRFGLTGGIHSLDPTEITSWCEQVAVGNAYVNRTITGAIVGRQPFGGWKASAVGPATKAGGPNYVASLCRWRTGPAPERPGQVPEAARPVLQEARARLAPEEIAPLTRTAVDYRWWWEREFGVERDRAGLTSESNRLRYRPLPRGVLVVAGGDTDPAAVLRARLAAAICGTPVRVVTPAEATTLTAPDELPDRVRLLAGGSTEAVWSWAAHRGIAVDDHPVVDHGRLELWRWLREQAVSETVHRHGAVLGTAATRIRRPR